MINRLDLVILNAGILGKIGDLSATLLEDLKRVMDTNLWANKTVMDWLNEWGRPVGQVVMISSEPPLVLPQRRQLASAALAAGPGRSAHRRR